VLDIKRVLHSVYRTLGNSFKHVLLDQNTSRLANCVTLYRIQPWEDWICVVLYKSVPVWYYKDWSKGEQIRFTLNDFLPPSQAKSDSLFILLPLTHPFYFTFLSFVCTVPSMDELQPSLTRFFLPQILALEWSLVRPLIECFLQQKRHKEHNRQPNLHIYNTTMLTPWRLGKRRKKFSVLTGTNRPLPLESAARRNASGCKTSQTVTTWLVCFRSFGLSY